MLNVQSQFDEEELVKTKQQPPREDMERRPSIVELKKALSKLKIGKVSRSSGILPEMIKVTTKEEKLLEFFLLLAHRVLEERRGM